jgi:hypothetical protein
MLWSKKTSAAVRPNSPLAPKATAKGPIRVDIAQGGSQNAKDDRAQASVFSHLCLKHVIGRPGRLPCRATDKPSLALGIPLAGAARVSLQESGRNVWRSFLR